MKYMDIYKEIRRQSKLSFKEGMLAGHFLTRDIGRFFSVWFIKHNIVPNQITMFMISFGIIGSILFALPNVWCKLVGYACWLMWFAMDCSDGQVARYTKNFSQYGTEMDFMAHLIDHPCMNIAIWITFLQMKIIDPIWLSAFFVVSISIELIVRNILSFNFFHKKLHPEYVKVTRDERGLFRYLLSELISYPTMIICYSWIIVVDYCEHLGFSLWGFIVWLLIKTLFNVRMVLKTLNEFYK